MSWEIIVIFGPATQPDVAKIWLLSMGCITQGGTRRPHRMRATETRAAPGMKTALCVCVRV